jgi:hypothetical protein
MRIDRKRAGDGVEKLCPCHASYQLSVTHVSSTSKGPAGPHTVTFSGTPPLIKNNNKKIKKKKKIKRQDNKMKKRR